MSGHGYYEVTCICGYTIRSECVEFTCPKCDRLIELCWPAEYRPNRKPDTMEERTS